MGWSSSGKDHRVVAKALVLAPTGPFIILALARGFAEYMSALLSLSLLTLAADWKGRI